MVKQQIDYETRFSSHSSGNARWFDQKVTYDNLAIVSGAVKAFLDLKATTPNTWFDRQDIQKVASLNANMVRDYGKPAVTEKSAANEYDKFISQNLNVLAHAGILESKNTRPRRYKLNKKNRDVLDLIAGNETESTKFLIEYLEWALRQFNWWRHVETYLKSAHTKEDMQELKQKFTNLAIDTIKLGTRGSKSPDVEAGRIFSKVINPIAYKHLVPGIERGHVSYAAPSKYDLTYNRPNWRDAANRKPKTLTRKQYQEKLEKKYEDERNGYAATKVMREIRDRANGQPEIPDSSNVKATHVHHIFPRSEYPELADKPENLIALTPGQHLGQAHPNGNTGKIDAKYQRECVSQKLETIRDSVDTGDTFYSYDTFAKILQIGWDIHTPLKPDYASLKQVIIDYIV